MIDKELPKGCGENTEGEEDVVEGGVKRLDLVANIFPPSVSHLSNRGLIPSPDVSPSTPMVIAAVLFIPAEELVVRKNTASRLGNTSMKPIMKAKMPMLMRLAIITGGM